MAAAPEGSSVSRMEKIDETAETLGNEPEYDFPYVSDSVLYLVKYLDEIGESKISGGSLVSIGWNDLTSWMEATKTELTAGEAIAIVNLSRLYVSQYYKSREKGCPSPCVGEFPKADRVATKLKALFSMLRK